MENNNGKGIFYGVIGVATLIVAIIGATFAYFTASTTSNEYLSGTAATAGLSVHVVRMTGASTADTETKYVMVPQLDKGLSSAIVGRASGSTGGTPCIDANGSLVCSIYKITVQNTGSAAIDVSGRIDFYTSAALNEGTTHTDGDTGTTEGGDALADEPTAIMNHLKWARLENPTSMTPKTMLNAAVMSNVDKPTSLLTYTGNYDTYKNAQGQDVNRTYQVENANQYLYGRAVTTYVQETEDGQTKDSIDVLGATPEYVKAHGAHYDIIDPTSDLTKAEDGTYTPANGTQQTAYTYNTNGGKTANGAYHLNAMGQAGDTMVYYIVVWISENNMAQNKNDTGAFVGQVTFNSAGGTGATSTFTEAYTAG